ncbi:unnamed protein product, partial [Cladocopium goreaui]
RFCIRRSSCFVTEELEELRESRESHTNSRDVTKLAKTILRLTTVLGLGPTGSNAQGRCEDHRVSSGDNETWWIWLSIFLLAVAWVGFAVAAYKLWLRMNQRMAHNELQQAETATFMGNQRDLLDEQRANLQEFRTRYNNYVRQTDQGLATLEEYVDCVHDGLVHYGGFVRFNEITLQQRSTSSANGGQSKEEEPTSDAEILENDSNTREGESTGIIKHLRDQVNEALAFEHYEDATDIQTTLTAVLEAANFSPHLTLDMQEGSLEHIRDFTGEPETEVIMRCQEFTRRLQKICIGFCEQ